MADNLPPNWRDLDGIGSYNECIAEMRRRYLAGEPVHELPMFKPSSPATARRPAGSDK